MALEELVGSSEERVLAILGQPDSKSSGDVWPPIEPLDSEGNPNMNCLRENGDYAEEAHRGWGPKPQKILFPMPYKVWTYDNVHGATWVLYLTSAESSSHATSAAIEEPPDSREVLNIFNRPLPKLRRYKNPRLELSGPLVVAEVLSYPTGAIF